MKEKKNIISCMIMMGVSEKSRHEKELQVNPRRKNVTIN